MPARYKYAFVVLQFLVFLFLFSSPAHSFDVVINEFFPDPPTGVDESVEEWIELYNKSDGTIDISGWVLKDAIDTHFLIIENISIGPREFVVIKRNNASLSLNNTSDEVRLFTSTASATPVDSYAYSKVYTDLSWGRIPDGTGDFVNKLVPSPGSHNQAPTPEPTPTPAPTSTPTSTSSTSTSNTYSNEEDEAQESQEIEEYQGVVAGYKTTSTSPTSTYSADLEILPISPATFSAIEIINEEGQDTESGESDNNVNIPIIIGSGLTISGIVAYLHKRYNIGSLWKKLTSKKS